MRMESKSSMEFSLGLALLVLILLCITGFFSCCFYWDRLSALLQPSVHEASNSRLGSGHSSPKNTTKAEPNQDQNLTVLMPGDQLPKFVALPSPCDVKQNHSYN